VKGLELPGYEPRAVQTLALGLAVGTRGADHNRSGAYEIDFSEDADRLHGDEHSAASAIETEDRAALIDSLILCKFVRGALEHFYSDCGEILTAVTGRQFGESELQTIAGRIVDLRKAFNIREGWRPGDDTLPKRFLTEALPSGPVRGARLPRARLEAMIHAYNLARGWEADGSIPSATFERLLDDLNLTGTDSAHAMRGGRA
jgi:aldehyde:ferredoxin oxidoreductase